MTGERDSTTPNRPLAGIRVLVTRARHQAAGLVEPLEALGAEVLVAPVIDTIAPESWAPADAAIDRLASYHWVVLTSTNAVDRFTARLAERGVPLEALAERRVAVVGAATAERLAELGITPALVPDDFRAEGLVACFEREDVAGMRVLVPRAQKAREILPNALREMGAEVDVVPVYRTVPAAPDPAVLERLRAGTVDVVTFTSPSTVRHFLTSVAEAGLVPRDVMARIASASIGPVTSEALRTRGYAVPIEAAVSTATGLVEAIIVHCAEGPV